MFLCVKKLLNEAFNTYWNEIWYVFLLFSVVLHHVFIKPHFQSIYLKMFSRLSGTVIKWMNQEKDFFESFFL